MRNLRMHLEFDGTDFHGWQRQPGLRTVQGVVEDALSHLVRHPVDVVGAGRTDAGVHALDYVCNAHVDSKLSSQRVAQGLTALLPDDVAVLAVHDAPTAFHARFDALSRRYTYTLCTRRTALERRVCYAPRAHLDAERMALGARRFVGEHDFTSFTPVRNEADPVCHVLEADVRRDGDHILFTVEADRFLHHMVRVMTGTLVEVGRGRMDPEHVATVLCTKDRRGAGPTAPPHGLALVAVRYPHAAT